MPTDQSDAIRQAAQEPAEASVDGQSVKQRSIAEQIEAAKLAASTAAVKKPMRGLRFSKLSPPGGD